MGGFGAVGTVVEGQGDCLRGEGVGDQLDRLALRPRDIVDFLVKVNARAKELGSERKGEGGHRFLIRPTKDAPDLSLRWDYCPWIALRLAMSQLDHELSRAS